MLHYSVIERRYATTKFTNTMMWNDNQNPLIPQNSSELNGSWKTYYSLVIFCFHFPKALMNISYNTPFQGFSLKAAPNVNIKYLQYFHTRDVTTFDSIRSIL